MADLLEIQGETNPFRIRAYRNAVYTVQESPDPIRKIVEEGADLTELPAIGKDMASHITELVTTGRLSILDEIARQVPRSLVQLTRLPGVGPKKVRKLWDELDITTIDDLAKAAAAGRIAELDGFGKKSEEKILEAIERHKKRSGRFRLSAADALVQPLLEYLLQDKRVERLEVAGSYRRRQETVGDIDLLAISSDPGPVMDRFTSFPSVQSVEKSGDTRGTVILSSDLQVDLRILPAESYGSALVYFTGNKEHNVELRKRALQRGLSVSEYGVFELAEEGEGEQSTTGRDLGERVAGRTEEEVYAAVGLPWITPELRTNRGELASAENGELPDLIQLGDMRGDLQMHSTWSDGKNTIEEMLTACAAKGYEYMALTDHSKALAMTGGLNAAKLREQWKEIEEVAARHPEIRFLRSQEVDILADGTLDTEDEMLEQLELVVIAVHSRFDLPAAQQTERLLTAIRHPLVNIVAHPTGRIINRRDPFDFALDEVLACAAEHDVAMELNAHPHRLDLRDIDLMAANKRGVKIVISTDAHSIADLDLMSYGVEQARRAWLEPADVLNTLPAGDLLAALTKD
jgi:DNA polymerase (family 10)